MKQVVKPRKSAATTDLQVRGLPVTIREKVRGRARRKGQTMSQYVIDLLRKDTDQPSLEEWLEEVRHWKPVPVRGGMTAAQAVREAREERAEQLARGFEERERARTSRS